MLLNRKDPREGRVISRNQLLEAPLTLNERLGSQVFPVEPEEVEAV
jgi:hypothetical protein